MTERPILYSPPMVQAILDDRKLQTRRMVKGDIENHPYLGSFLWDKKERRGLSLDKQNAVDICPYGKPGDVLWVRERFTTIPYHGIIKNPQYVFFDQVTNPEQHKWKPSIHMPKDAARIWLEVTDVRVERLQDISEEDAIKEGIEECRPIPLGWMNYLSPQLSFKKGKLYDGIPAACYSFASLWEFINGLYSWQLNPWVWVVSFKVLSTTGKAGIERKEGVV